MNSIIPDAIFASHPRTASRKSKPKSTRAADVVGSRDEALSKMLAAGARILPDYSPDELTAWANRTVDAYIARGVILIREGAL